MKIVRRACAPKKIFLAFVHFARFVGFDDATMVSLKANGAFIYFSHTNNGG